MNHSGVSSHTQHADHGGTKDLTIGSVVGAPRSWLMAEGAALLVVSLIAYSSTGHAWWLVPALVLLPDVFMGGYLHSTRLGAHVYNVAHATVLPAVMVGIGWWAGNSWAMAIGLIWLAHIGMDRSLAFGLKYDDHFQHTHLSGPHHVGAL
ncbi:MAG: DUF4260 domain-containing protein [Acidimicrobiales bacterium]|jgi:hypothetical protein